jgi:hypothetical protein
MMSIPTTNCTTWTLLDFHTSPAYVQAGQNYYLSITPVDLSMTNTTFYIYYKAGSTNQTIFTNITDRFGWLNQSFPDVLSINGTYDYELDIVGVQITTKLRGVAGRPIPITYTTSNVDHLCEFDVQWRDIMGLQFALFYWNGSTGSMTLNGTYTFTSSPTIGWSNFSSNLNASLGTVTIMWYVECNNSEGTWGNTSTIYTLFIFATNWFAVSVLTVQTVVAVALKPEFNVTPQLPTTVSHAIAKNGIMLLATQFPIQNTLTLTRNSTMTSNLAQTIQVQCQTAVSYFGALATTLSTTLQILAIPGSQFFAPITQQITATLQTLTASIFYTLSSLNISTSVNAVVGSIFATLSALAVALSLTVSAQVSHFYEIVSALAIAVQTILTSQSVFNVINTANIAHSIAVLGQTVFQLTSTFQTAVSLICIASTTQIYTVIASLAVAVQAVTELASDFNNILTLSVQTALTTIAQSTFYVLSLANVSVALNCIVTTAQEFFAVLTFPISIVVSTVTQVTFNVVSAFNVLVGFVIPEWVVEPTMVTLAFALCIAMLVGVTAYLFATKKRKENEEIQ